MLQRFYTYEGDNLHDKVEILLNNLPNAERKMNSHFVSDNILIHVVGEHFNQKLMETLMYTISFTISDNLIDINLAVGGATKKASSPVHPSEHQLLTEMESIFMQEGFTYL